jgi:uncharacterized repeat protein (TIGR02543 family)
MSKELKSISVAIEEICMRKKICVIAGAIALLFNACASTLALKVAAAPPPPRTASASTSIEFAAVSTSRVMTWARNTGIAVDADTVGVFRLPYWESQGQIDYSLVKSPRTPGWDYLELIDGVDVFEIDGASLKLKNRMSFKGKKNNQPIRVPVEARFQGSIVSSKEFTWTVGGVEDWLAKAAALPAPDAAATANPAAPAPAAVAVNAALGEPAVTFNAQGGSAVAAQKLTKGSTVPYPAEPTKAGAFFNGWYKEAACTNPCDYSALVSGPLTLYAKWLTENEMIAAEFGASAPEIFEVNNATAAAEGQPGWNTSWAKVVAAINKGSGRNYVIKVTGNFQLADVSSSTFTLRNIKVLVYAAANRTVSSSNYGDLLYAGANQALILRNITLQQGAARSSANAHLVMRPGTVVGYKVNVDGGGTFTMSGGSSGGVSVNGGTFTMSGGTISGNKNNYGGVYVEYGTFTMSGGTISGNTGGIGGSGVSVGKSSTFTMNSGTISGNTGVGVSVSGGTFTMNSGAISGNTGGGGVSVSGGTFTMSGGAINGNTANGGGDFSGGVYVEYGTFTMSGGTISGNSGDGVYIAKGGTFTMGAGTVSGNNTNNGGGVNVDGGIFTMGGGTISGNVGSSGGGGAYIAKGGTFTMNGGVISDNTTVSSAFGFHRDGNGGGVYVDSGTFMLGGGTIYGKGAGAGRANRTGAVTGASLAIKDTAAIAKYGNFGDILESGLATDETLVGKE